FYRFRLGSQEPVIDEVLEDCEDALFFSLVGDADENDVWAADNACTNEVFFFRAGSALAYDYAHGSTDHVTGADFTCAATVHKPLADGFGDESELWFIMGDSSGEVTQYGATNLEVVTQQRYGVNFASVWQTGLGDFGNGRDQKIVRT